METDPIDITESDVIAFIAYQNKKAFEGMPEIAMPSLYPTTTGFTAHGFTIKPDGQWGESVYASGSTIAATISALRSKIPSHESRVKQLREDAARLLAEAEALSPSTQNEKAPAL
jgi:hypothetical protein